MRNAAYMALAATLACSSCSLLIDFDPADMQEDTVVRCSDGVDNDENGLTDCAEPGCAQFEFCQERSEEACHDRKDNDRDGLVDCEDGDCSVFEACNELLVGGCDDGLDNNDNGLIDCQDFTCHDAPQCCCPDPVPVPHAAMGLGQALRPRPEAWDREVVADPTVVLWQGAHHLFYTGRDHVTSAGAIGHAVRPLDASDFERDPVDEPILLAGRDGLPAGVDLSGATAVIHPGNGSLHLYFAVRPHVEGKVGASAIHGVTSTDGVSFEPLQRADVTSANPGALLAPETASPDGWERSIASPTVVARGPQDFIMLYTGRTDPEDPFTAQIGLARSTDGVHWQGLWEPVLSPPEDALLRTALSDPSLTWDAEIDVFRLWYVWREGADFMLYHAVGTADGLLWIPYPENPVLQPGRGPWCDDRYLDGPSVLWSTEGRLSMWYHGRSESLGHGVCYAESALSAP